MTSKEVIQAFESIQGVEEVSIVAIPGIVRITVIVTSAQAITESKAAFERVGHFLAPRGVQVSLRIDFRKSGEGPALLGGHLPPHNLDIDEVIYLRSK